MSEADIDLKGNTNFVVLKDLNDNIVVPRTNLAAVDMTVANGLAVAGSTLYANLATAEDIQNGTQGHLIDAAGIKAFLPVAGDGITVDGATIATDRASTEETITGDAAAAAKTLSVEALHGALSTGKAVDVTSTPNASAGTLTYATDLRGTITWATTAAGSVNIGFYNNNTKFPKFASGLAYILMADVKNTSSAAVTLTYGGTAVNEAAGEIAAGATKRVAMLFTTATTGYFSFTATASTTLEITNLREFEVTGCTTEARKYIAALSNPDDFTKFYLVDYDEQNPWTYIIDMGNNPSVTLMAGLSYKLDATEGTHTLTTDTCPIGYNGEDAHLTLFVGLTGNVVFQSPLNLIDPLTPGAGHNITVKFRDGQANAYVDDTDIGYVITVNSGTASGSLYYALTTATENYAVFANGTDGTPVDLAGVVAAQGAKNVVGNGYERTTITGSGAFTSKTTFTNLSMDGVVVTGGTMTMGDVYISSGSTVSVSGGQLAVEKVSGNGGVIDLGQTRVSATSPVVMSGVTVANGHAYGEDVYLKNGGGLLVHRTSAFISSCLFSSNHADRNGGAISTETGGYVTVTDCVFEDNTADFGRTAIQLASPGTGYTAVLNISNCVFKSGQNIYTGGTTTLEGSNSLLGTVAGVGSAIIASGAIVDLTGNTNTKAVATNNGVTFAPGGATVYPSAGSASAYYLGGVTIPQIGNTNVVNLGGSANVVVPVNGVTNISGCTFSGGSASYLGGAILVSSGALFSANGCTFSGNYSNQGGAIGGMYATIKLSSCEIVGNTAGTYGALVCSGGSAEIIDCNISGNTVGQSYNGVIYARLGASVTLSGCTADHLIHLGDSASVVTFGGSNSVSGVDGSGSVTISGGAIVDLTSTINPGGGITVLEGGCTVNGNAIAAGTYTSIDSTGTPT